MNSNSAYCEHCREFILPSLCQEKETTEVNGKVYSYSVQYGTCPRCGERATPDEIANSNQRAFLAEIRRQEKGLVSQSTVDSIPEIYNIGKRPLSQLLDWGEHTYSRFLEGNVPSSEHSETIKRIARSPLAFLYLLRRNKGSITDVAYRKSFNAAVKALNTKKDNQLERAAAYLLAKTGDCSSMGLQKELYYTQAFSLALYETPFFNDECKAWVHGPVYPTLRYELGLPRSDEQELRSEELAEAVSASFSKSELELLDAIIDHVACYSPNVLRNFTHKEDPWKKTRGSLPNEAPSDAIIPQEEIKKYFCEVRDSFGIEKPQDIQKYMQHMLANR